ncbi:MAG: peptidoglycan DD-metalloendopeptidase family protein [candidate division KSB1 bacterium]|nr:peptidoglycan DD-metalloendopeptidase family protein [candidate division KSB1 bacterium]MDZ7275316.1 peptidoglycan DD-metalloendopeptidase family protein [candidate division KSB1 bacterium]MDZ7287483.1 peptidoglycan DD-metalloendopeptidase family protein [candidate division KSB1 bacterium]MDZ7299597.1 peptidoglycan DD-metalloendopeptidase family protein [candidate division KSB1 bacterium]MDZ7307465.1 peptidoglycan DD-metalloendopeptidase family protein [candidate division KSB1 bacterium]
MFSSFVVMLLMVGSSIALFTDFYKDESITRLNRTNQALTKQLQHMSAKVAELDSRMQVVEQNDDDLRVYAELPRLDPDLRKAGTGGAAGAYVDVDLNLLPDAVRNETRRVNQMLAELERRIALHFENNKEVKEKITNDRAQLKHTPSIRPVEAGRITDKYGKRLDPFIERVKHHNGVDISAEIGTEVYAAAAGVVVAAKSTYSLGQGYGRHVIIDHGYGYKTLYGHLSEVWVKEGQRIERWDVIGLVGNTGRTTGPHLHFEVHKDDTPVDPQNFFLN